MRDNRNAETLFIGIGCIAWLIYAVLFVAFWGVVAWAIISLVQANT